MSNYKVEQMRESVMNLYGKNLFYSKEYNYLYWCDVLSGQIFRMDFNNNYALTTFRILGENTISFIVPIYGKKDQFIVGAGRRLLLVNWDGYTTMGQITKVLTEVPVNGVRINAFNIDKQGRLYFGTMFSEEQGEFDFSKRVGGLYRYTMTDGLVQLKDKVGLGNGITWNNTFTKMFFVDSFDLSLYEYDFDFKTGTIGNQKIFTDLSNYGQAKKIFPTGLTTDFEDNIYVSMFGNGNILKINYKTKKVDFEYKTNVQQITGMVFGNKEMDTMYFTTAGMGFGGFQPQYPSGYLMNVKNMGTYGMEMFNFAL